MAVIIDRCRTFWQRIEASPAVTQARVPVIRDHVDTGAKLGGAFVPDRHYFTVRVNRMYLHNKREWTSLLDPMVVCMSEFLYDKKEQDAVPFVIGPTRIQQIAKGVNLSDSDTRVAGIHPYRGGRLKITIVLLQVQRDVAKDLLKMVESTAGALDFGAGLSTYLKIGNVLLDGIDSLFGLSGTEPVVGHSKQFDPDGGDEFVPGYYALIDLPESQFSADRLWVKKNELCEGPNMLAAQPLRTADYVLYSITQTDRRSDIRALPFYPLWERVQKEAGAGRPDAFENAKTLLSGLVQDMRLSADLTEDQCTEIVADWRKKTRERYDEAVGIGKLAKGKGSKFQAIRDEALDILKL